jgi:hypothetical protein
MGIETERGSAVAFAVNDSFCQLSYLLINELINQLCSVDSAPEIIKNSVKHNITNIQAC